MTGGLGTMLHAWWNTNMDARRSISLLIDVAGLAVVALGLAASPVPLAFGGNYAAVVGPVLGATVGGYLRHRVSDPERAPLWALAYGASVAAILVATFGTAAVIRPTVHGIPGLGDAASGIIVTGFLVAFVGALLWERDARRRRFEALLTLAVPADRRRGRPAVQRRPVGVDRGIRLPWRLRCVARRVRDVPPILPPRRGLCQTRGASERFAGSGTPRRARGSRCPRRRPDHARQDEPR